MKVLPVKLLLMVSSVESEAGESAGSVTVRVPVTLPISLKAVLRFAAVSDKLLQV